MCEPLSIAAHTKMLHIALGIVCLAWLVNAPCVFAL